MLAKKLLSQYKKKTRKTKLHKRNKLQINKMTARLHQIKMYTHFVDSTYT